MPKVPRGLHIIKTIGGANKTRVQYSHARIEEPANHWLVVYICVSGGDLCNGPFPYLLRGEDTELYPYDTRGFTTILY